MKKGLKHILGCALVGLGLMMLRVRWGYFHVHPHYIKFKMETDTYFQNIKTGEICCDFTLQGKGEGK